MTRSNQMQRLEAVLSAFGADRARWPDADRAALDNLIARDAEAAAAVAREAEFDQVLSAAPANVSQSDLQGAKDRLFARLGPEAPVQAPARPSASVVPLTPNMAKASAPLPRTIWRELSVMAAALLIGFFTVSLGVFDGSGLDLTELTASVDSTSGDTDDVSAIALGTTGDDSSEEDLL